MKTKYLCPNCENALNVGDNIVLKVKNNFGQKGIVFLHSELGNYETDFSAEFTLIEGEKVKFYCPLCNHSLTNFKNDRLAHFTMIIDDEKEYTIAFSQIYGEKCTYKIEEKEVIEKFGMHWSMYTNPDWFLFK